MDQKKEPLRRQDFSTLDAHKRTGKVLTPPMMQLPTPIHLHSWQNERLPEALWAILLTGTLSREEYMPLLCKVAKGGMQFRKQEKVFPSHTRLAALSSQEFD